MRSVVIPAFVMVLVPAVAQAEAPASWLSARLSLGLDGEVEVEGAEDDLDLGVGGEILSHQRIHDLAAIYGGLSVLSWNTEDSDGDRNTLIDLTVGPMGLFPVTDTFTVYLAGRIGGTLSLIGEDEFPGGDVDPAVGWHFGARMGGRLEVAEDLGFEADLGITRHHATHEIDTFIGSQDVEGEVTQLLLRLGLSWTLRE